jgi:predicted nucleic acid-binding protein
MKRLFLDSSVLFSAAYSPRGKARHLILMAIRKEIIAVISQLVLTETVRNLDEKAPDKAHLLEVIIDHVPFEYVQPNKREVLAAADHVELKDAPIIAAAKKDKVDLLVTLDKKHLLGKPELAKYIGVDIVTPSEAVKRL